MAFDVFVDRCLHFFSFHCLSLKLPVTAINFYSNSFLSPIAHITENWSLNSITAVITENRSVFCNYREHLDLLRIEFLKVVGERCKAKFANSLYVCNKFVFTKPCKCLQD